MFFFANDDKSTRVDMRTVHGILDKYNEPPYLLELITTQGKRTLSYSDETKRANDIAEMQQIKKALPR